MANFTYGTDYIDYQNGNEQVRLMAWGKNSLRVISNPSGPVNLDCAALLEVEPTEAIITIEDGIAKITNGKITGVIDESNTWNPNGKLSFYNQKGELLLKEAYDGPFLDKPRWFRGIPGGDFRLQATFSSNPEEKIYGMGQYQQNILNLKGCNLELAHRNSQVSIPFYVSNLGYGFFWHNPAVGTVSFGTNTTEWRAESTKQLDYWITAGDNPAEIESQYSDVTGHAPMMPEYGLGFWQCKLRYSSQEEVLKIAREYHKRKIPVDVLVIDYYHWPRCGDFRFDENFFPDPKAMADEVRSYGMELMVSIWPQIESRSENYNEMKRKGLLVKTDRGIDVQMLFHGNNVFYDATNPKARRYVWEKVKKNYRENGIRLFWLDEAEPEYGTYDFDMYRYYIGSALQKTNLYPREYVRGFDEGEQTDYQEHSIKLVRCAWAGSQRYGALVWSGDIHSNFEVFKRQIVAGLQMGLAGIPWWTTDIGGFHGGNIYDNNFQELLIRWFQWATFCPVMRLHGSRHPQTPLFKADGEPTEMTGAANEIWSYGEENYEIMKKFILIRESLRDYTRELMREASEKGTPVMRTMFYDFPEDVITWDLDTQYMYGSDILVAPIVEEKATERWIYLPEGVTWVDARDGNSYEGGQWIKAQATIDTLPIFLKEGKQEYLIGRV
ncbi:MAG TPA: glycoside hydrolase family 31 protein [Candidatus Tetragenococcus pullicola]|nr:glycoside hydrolase family 31 protein [Candidatus Tetragenococcus pullicola]